MGMKIKTYRYIKARELWNLINVCGATRSSIRTGKAAA
jgi:hypothetical protein